jgi:hypothetical protein
MPLSSVMGSCEHHPTVSAPGASAVPLVLHEGTSRSFVCVSSPAMNPPLLYADGISRRIRPAPCGSVEKTFEPSGMGVS